MRLTKDIKSEEWTDEDGPRWRDRLHRLAWALQIGGLAFWLLAPFLFTGWLSKTPHGVAGPHLTFTAEAWLTGLTTVLFLIAGSTADRPSRTSVSIGFSVLLQLGACAIAVYQLPVRLPWLHP